MALLLLTPARPGGLPGAAEGDDRLAELANETHLAYVITGDTAVDQESEAGLKGLTRVLEQRTAVEAAEPAAVDLAKDELALFPLLYWPIPPDHSDLAPETVRRVADYLHHGGMILFDTRDAATSCRARTRPAPANSAWPNPPRASTCRRSTPSPPTTRSPAPSTCSRTSPAAGPASRSGSTRRPRA